MKQLIRELIYTVLFVMELVYFAPIYILYELKDMFQKIAK